jgi:hypothetical protein
MWSRGDGEGISWDIREWSCKTFIPKMLIGKGASRVVRRRAISLKQQGLDIFPPYADSELAILSPQALFAQPPINHFHLSQFVNCSQ